MILTTKQDAKHLFVGQNSQHMLDSKIKSSRQCQDIYLLSFVIFLVGIVLDRRRQQRTGYSKTLPLPPKKNWIHTIYSVCVCVCVCVWERGLRKIVQSIHIRLHNKKLCLNSTDLSYLLNVIGVHSDSRFRQLLSILIKWMYKNQQVISCHFFSILLFLVYSAVGIQKTSFPGIKMV